MKKFVEFIINFFETFGPAFNALFWLFTGVFAAMLAFDNNPEQFNIALEGTRQGTIGFMVTVFFILMFISTFLEFILNSFGWYWLPKKQRQKIQ